MSSVPSSEVDSTEALSPDTTSEIPEQDGWQPNPLEAERLAKLARLEERGVLAYPARVARSHRCAEAAREYEQFEASAG